MQPTCGCFGGGAVEPDDAGAENENDRREWLDFMQNACDWAKGKTWEQFLYCFRDHPYLSKFCVQVTGFFVSTLGPPFIITLPKGSQNCEQLAN